MLLSTALYPLGFNLSYDKYLKNLREPDPEEILAIAGSALRSHLLWSFCWNILGQGTGLTTPLCPGSYHVPRLSALPPNIKLVYFLYARPNAELQGYENKQDQSYLERPYREVEVPACLIQWKGINWASLVTVAPFQRKHYSFRFPLYLVISQLPSPLCILYLPREIFSTLVNPKRKAKWILSRGGERSISSNLPVTPVQELRRDKLKQAQEACWRPSQMTPTGRWNGRGRMCECAYGHRDADLLLKIISPHNVLGGGKNKICYACDDKLYSIALYKFSTHLISALLCAWIIDLRNYHRHRQLLSRKI